MFSYNYMGALGAMQIRLLHLLPAIDINSPIECRLEVVAFEQNPVYEALSYCWGDSTELVDIKCNNEEFQVTKNLFSALQHLRDDHSERTIWIDAICINQNDLEERRSQVLLMKDIYSRSERVVVWLGPDPDSDGIDHFYNLLQTIPNLPSVRLTKKQRTFMEMNLANMDHILQEEAKLSAQDAVEKEFAVPEQVQKGAIAILKRSWWTRIWTVQEVILAPSVLLVCGNLAASLSEVRQRYNEIIMHSVSNALDNSDDHIIDFGDLLSDPDGNLNIASARLRRSSNISRDLGGLLHVHRWLKAKDPRDKVYGFLGVATSTYGIEPDYTISTVECYTRAAFNIISASRSLDIFNALRMPSCLESTLTGLPSWVPDWSYDFCSIPEEEKGPSLMSNPVIRDISRTSTLLQMRGVFPESKASQSSLPFTVQLTNDHKALVLRGFIFDKLISVGDVLKYSWEGPKTLSSNAILGRIRDLGRTFGICSNIGGVTNTIRGWQDLVFRTGHLQKLPGETRMDTFLTTLLSNRIRRSANRRDVLDYVEQSIERGFKMTKTGIVLKQLHLSRLVPKLYHGFLGYRKLIREDPDDLFSFGKCFSDILGAYDQRMAITGSGYLCLVPWPTQAGDRIALLQGGRTPFVLRKAGDKWKMIGDCYVHGIMSGEAWSDGKCVDVEIV